ncbi:globin-like protein [Lipomyces japonicus]|uniref:globin-like protein n=1 Tax=Lipomyces japonicus TaxID=56871 RepID=UPI0034CEF90E
MALTPEQVKIIKATVPVLKDHGATITTVFYKNLLEANPELHNIFNTVDQVNGQQPRALAGALFAYATYIDDLGVLAPAVELICQKHASLYVQPGQYDVVATFLLAAMKEVLGDALTPEVHDAWAAAYWQLANIMIKRESDLYVESDNWIDWREFIVDKKTAESDLITSFYLKPVDGKLLPTFLPGQYISLQVFVPELNYLQARQYSLSDRPHSDYYRISVKKEAGLSSSDPATVAHPGYVSNILHDFIKEGDKVRISHPFGDFFLTKGENAHPVVLLSAGVGLTPLISILNTLASSAPNPNRKIHFIHGSHNTSSRAFKDHVKKLSSEYPGLRATYFTTDPSAEDKQGVDYDRLGHVEINKLVANNDLYLDNSNTEYYICGPNNFMTDVQKALKALHVSGDKIKLELFGTGGIATVD